ncbi:hypothetical protein LCGC14_2849440, partial [marine sediment metagenome]
MNLSVRLTRAAKHIEELEYLLAEARAENERLLRLVDRDVDRADQVAMEVMGKRDAAIERGVAVWKGAEQQRGMLLLLLWMRTVEHDDDHEALDRAEAREKGLREALEGFSLWLEQECKRGTLDLGFGPDWSAKKVQLALDRLLANV